MLGIDAALDRMPAMHNRPLQHVPHVRARGNHDLALHQIHIRHHLRHRMLHLNPRIHLDEVQPAVLIHQKFDRARIGVADLGQRLAQNLADLIAQLRRHLRRGRFFQQLLMPPLDRTFSLAQAHHIAVLIRQHLKLDVPRMLDDTSPCKGRHCRMRPPPPTAPP